MSESATRTVTTWFLEQTAPGDLVDARASGGRETSEGPDGLDGCDRPDGSGGLHGCDRPDGSGGLRIVRAEVPSAAFSRFLYREVGADVEWTDRLPWTREQWGAWLERPGVETWVAYERGTPAGYIELDGASEDTSGRATRPGATVEISYFGLLPAFRGQGIGRRLLACGTRRAWDLAERWDGRLPTARVWVHTCSKDGPHALGNYQRRGFRIYAKEVALEPEPGFVETGERAAGAVPAPRPPRPPGTPGAPDPDPGPGTYGPRSAPM